ncbi:homoserine dehydrogenase [Fusibacillus kribbianus]|uniref:Homoserine dehydrogenase n=1 Tax=Fusibacillus kribbianus TaxID=3044208 RepID=A0AAP4BDE0_9FIRM|nr:homoserine dehydrogenase [Ruminococcus sp. YH-rum2234]MDI9242299.1 homoserine dehydrogenase [Ruminococcus sp. YH-rum2234]
MKKIRIAILGLGTVGGGVYRLLEMRKAEMPKRAGVEIEVAKILVRNIEKAAKKADRSLLTNDWQEIIGDDSISVIIEVMGGMEPAGTYIMEALKAGRHVVSANKDLIAVRGRELLMTAKENHCDFLFEASVAGGIPILRPLKQCLAGNEISDVMGIVNGTTNFILTKMTDENMEFDEALAVATELGYAEADPTADVEGYDAARKVAIMASIAFHSRVTFNDVYTEGISRISAKDIKYARELGCDIKLLGVAKNTPDGIEARVHPMLIPCSHPLASVKDAFNAVFVHGDAVDDAMFYGRGAGEMPTASAVVGDVIDILRNMEWGSSGRIGCSCYRDLPIKEIGDIESKYFMRLHAEDRPGVLATIAAVFGNNGVSIAKLIQKNTQDGFAEIVIVTDSVRERHFQDAMAVLEGMSVIRKISRIIRVL